MLQNPSLKAITLAAGTASALMLAAALIGQYGFSLYPCELCMFQRYPYIAIIVLALVSLRVSERARWMIVLLCAGLFLLDAGIAFYHAGVELEWFKGPDACSSTSKAGDSLEEMRRQIMNAPLVSCSQAMAYVFGLSLAAWNAIIAFLLAVATLGTLCKCRRGERNPDAC